MNAPSDRAPERVVGYLRVSSHEQVQHGYGLVTQRATLEAACRREGWQLVGVYEDPGVSGTLPWFERAGLTAALDAMRVTVPPVTGLLVARWDRLARDTLEALLVEREVAKVGARVLCADGTNGGDDSAALMRTVMHGLAEYDRKQIVARLTAGKAAKAAAGGYSGGRPRLGYKAQDKTLVVDEQAAKLVRWIFTRVARDRWTARRVARELDERRALGRHWDHAKVLGVLHHEGYKRAEHGGPVVDPRIYNAAHRVLAARRSHAKAA